MEKSHKKDNQAKLNLEKIIRKFGPNGLSCEVVRDRTSW